LIIVSFVTSYPHLRAISKKMKYPGNIEITHKDTIIPGGNSKDGYIKAEQFYYFDTEKLDYTVVGSMRPESFDLLLDFIKNLKVPLERIIENL